MRLTYFLALLATLLPSFCLAALGDDSSDPASLFSGVGKSAFTRVQPSTDHETDSDSDEEMPFTPSGEDGSSEEYDSDGDYETDADYYVAWSEKEQQELQQLQLDATQTKDLVKKANADLKLGIMHASMLNLEPAFTHLKNAAEQVVDKNVSLNAHFALGDLYKCELLDKPYPKKAIEHFKKAYDPNVKSALNAEIDLNLGEIYGALSDYQQALKHYGLAAQQDIDAEIQAIANLKLGFLYKQHVLINGKPAYGPAFDHFEKAFKSNIDPEIQIEACFELAQMYDLGQGVEKNKQKAYGLYDSVARNSNDDETRIRAQARVDLLLGNSFYIRSKPDFKQARFHYQKAFDLSPEVMVKVKASLMMAEMQMAAYNRLKQMSLMDLRELKQAYIDYHQTGAPTDQLQKKFNLSDIINAHRTRSDFPYIERMYNNYLYAANNSTDQDLRYQTLFKLGQLYMRGIGLKNTSDKRAVEPLEVVAKQTFNQEIQALAQSMLGNFYSSNPDKSKHDYKKALNYFNEAISNNPTPIVQAKLFARLGELFINKEFRQAIGIPDNDYRQAIRSNTQAAQQTDDIPSQASGALNLGLINKNGWGLKEPNDNRALKWFKLVIELDDSPEIVIKAHFESALLYDKKKEYKQAMQHYKQIIEQTVFPEFKPAALFNVGLMYLLGQGVKQPDLEQAIIYLTPACQQNYRSDIRHDSYVKLIKIYLLKKDYKKAIATAAQALVTSNTHQQYKLHPLLKKIPPRYWNIPLPYDVRDSTDKALNNAQNIRNLYAKNTAAMLERALQNLSRLAVMAQGTPFAIASGGPETFIHSKAMIDSETKHGAHLSITSGSLKTSIHPKHSIYSETKNELESTLKLNLDKIPNALNAMLQKKPSYIDKMAIEGFKQVVLAMIERRRALNTILENTYTKNIVFKAMKNFLENKIATCKKPIDAFIWESFALEHRILKLTLEQREFNKWKTKKHQQQTQTNTASASSSNIGTV